MNASTSACRPRVVVAENGEASDQAIRTSIVLALRNRAAAASPNRRASPRTRRVWRRGTSRRPVGRRAEPGAHLTSHVAHDATSGRLMQWLKWRSSDAGVIGNRVPIVVQRVHDEVEQSTRCNFARYRPYPSEMAPVRCGIHCPGAHDTGVKRGDRRLGRRQCRVVRPGPPRGRPGPGAGVHSRQRDVLEPPARGRLRAAAHRWCPPRSDPPLACHRRRHR